MRESPTRSHGASLVTFALASALAGVGCATCSNDKVDDATSSAGSSGAVITEAIAAKVAGPLPTTGATSAPLPFAVECASPGQVVSPTIWGIAWADGEKDLNAPAHRWGGNTTSRYNWKLGNAWNTANDWFWQNLTIDSYEVFLKKAADKGGSAAITVPMIGWVAKDNTSASFPVSVFGPQEKTDPDHPDFGNGKKPDGKTLIAPGDPTRANVEMTPEEVGQWVAKIRAADAKRGGKRLVFEYILDNEPALWDSTHRDVHPEPLSYDELLKRTIAYGTAVRKADPDAIIAGPAEWGWPNYFFSAKDAKAGFASKPDRMAHGDEPILEWYLRKLAEHEKKTGTRILDVLDVHFYTQADGVQGPDGHGGDGGGKTDRATNDMRFRATRALWDRRYKDESWINDAIYLLPRMKEIIAKSYPGLGLQIGEFNFGAEAHIAGAVALAEAYGRMAQYQVTHAFYWTYPKKPEPAYWAFRAYRNYDGHNGHFLERMVPTSAPGGTSLFASRDEAGKKYVLVALNFKADRPEDASIELLGCTAPAAVKSFVYTGGEGGFVSGDVKVVGTQLKAKMPPYSITVIELNVRD